MLFKIIKDKLKQVIDAISSFSFLEHTNSKDNNNSVSNLTPENYDSASEDRYKILDNGWAQGALITSQNNQIKLLELPYKKHHIFVLVSHSCDIVAYSYKKEPYVEFIGAEYSSVEDKSLSNRKNPRKLQLPILNGTYPFINLDINSRFFIKRPLLSKAISENSSLSIESQNELQIWIASRYRRSAFPDTFNTRINKAKIAIEKDIKKNGDRNIYGLYLGLNSLEELPYDGYEIVLMGVIKEELGEIGDQKWREAEDYLEFVANEFSNCDKIKVIHFELVSDSTITLKVINDLKLLDFDYLSHRDDIAPPELNL